MMPICTPKLYGQPEYEACWKFWTETWDMDDTKRDRAVMNMTTGMYKGFLMTNVNCM